MRRRSRLACLPLALFALLALGTPATIAETDEKKGLREVKPGVWVAIQPEPLRFNDSNSVVLLSEEDVVVVDSQANPATSRALIEAVAELTDRPVRFLVNTHFHSDHTRSNFVFRDRFPRVEIVGHRSLLEDIPARAAPDLDRELALYRTEIPAGEKRLAKGVDRSGEALDEAGKKTLAAQIEAAKSVLAELESIRWELPSLALSGTMTLERSLGPIEIRSAHAHTRGDLIVYLPERGVLVTGDVLDDLPFGGHGYPGDWIEVLDELEALDWDVLVPGHGSVLEGAAAREHLATVRSLFELMLESARASAEAEAEPEAARTAFLESAALAPIREFLAGDDPLAGRAFDDFVPAGFGRAWLEVTGALVD